MTVRASNSQVSGDLPHQFDEGPLVILALTENAETFRILEESFSRVTPECGPAKVLWCGTIQEARRQIRSTLIDVVIAEFPDDRIEHALADLQALDQPFPILVVSDSDLGAVADRAIRAGAQDHIPRTELRSGGLRRTVRSAVQRKANDRRIRSDASAAEASSRRKSLFISKLGQEFRAPLNLIVGSAALLRGEDSPDERERFIENIETAGRELLEAVEQMRTLVQIERGEWKVGSQEVELTELATGIVNAYTKRSVYSDLTVMLEVGPGIPPWIRIDRAAVVLVLNHLIRSARRFARDARSIRVRLTASSEQGTSKEIELVISDDGAGFDAAELMRAMRPFEPAQSDTISAIDLGIPIVHELTLLLGGKLSINARGDSGSSLRVVLPYLECDPPRADSPERRSSPHTRPRVLYVEDNELNRRVAVRLLERQGFTVECAFNGESGVEKYSEGNYDIVLMDLQMPVMNGYDATAKIRDLERRRERRIPIVALTTYASDDDHGRWRDVGMDDFISKPFKLDELVKCLNRLLGR